MMASYTGVPLAQDSLLLEAGLDFNISAAATLGVSYSGQFASDVTDNAVKGRLHLAVLSEVCFGSEAALATNLHIVCLVPTADMHCCCKRQPDRGHFWRVHKTGRRRTRPLASPKGTAFGYVSNTSATSRNMSSLPCKN